MATINKNRGVIQLNKKHRLLTCESIAVLILIVGTIATVITHELILTAAPLTFLVVLNLHNRRQLDQLAYQFASRRLTNIHLLLQMELQAIQRHFQRLDNPYGRAEMLQICLSIETLSDKLETLKATNSTAMANQGKLQSLETVLTELKTQALQCKQNLATLNLGFQSNSALQVSYLTRKLVGIATDGHHCQNSSRTDAQLLERIYWQLLCPILVDVFYLQARIISITSHVGQRNQPILNSMTVEINQLQRQILLLNRWIEKVQAEWCTQVHHFKNSVQEMQSSIEYMHEQLVSFQLEDVSLPRKDILSFVLSTEVSQYIHSMLVPLYIQLVNLDNYLDQLNFEAHVTQEQSRYLLLLNKKLLAINKKILLIEKTTLTVTSPQSNIISE